MSVIIALVQALSCCGFGAVALRLSGLLNTLPPLERWGWSFTLGLGLLGWVNSLLAISGLAVTPAFIAVLGVALPFCLLLPRDLRFPPPVGWEWAVLPVIALAMMLDLSEALAPPADGDSLAYHFARVKAILEQARVLPVARAVDGATPMLLQMTYLPPLALGGERSLTLWTGLSGWLALLPLYGIARRWLERSWSLTLVVLVATVPCWIYGAGTGQVEARLAPFVLLALVALSLSLKDGGWRWALIAGMLAGFFAGSKFFGLAFCGLGGLALLLRRHWTAALVFGLAGVLAGGAWYVWHWVQLGDPLFPMLWRWLPTEAWDQAHADELNGLYYRSEKAVPPHVGWMLAYPLVASVAPFPIWEAARTGLGPLGLVLAPFALAGIWRRRHRLTAHPLAPVAVLAFAYYTIWFLSGTTQRIRHLLPLYPVLVLCLMVAARRWAEETGRYRALGFGFAAVLGLQMAGQALFSLDYLRHQFSDESRGAFLARNVVNYAAVPWINSHLGPAHRIMIGERQLIYLIDVPVYFAHDYFQARIDLLADAEQDLDSRLEELGTLGITHILVEPATKGPIARLSARLGAAGCTRRVAEMNGRVFFSRTLGLGGADTFLYVDELLPACRKKVETVPRLG